MKIIKLLNVFIALCSLTVFGQGGASSCAQLSANPDNYQTCASNISFTSSSTPSTENFFPGCFKGNSLVAPSWFIFTINNPGELTLEISQINSATGDGIDVDYALYGPFTNTNDLCSNTTNTNLVSCSFSLAAVESVSVPSSNIGDIYVLVIDNFGALSGQSGPITVTQTAGGTGSTDCGFQSSVKIKSTDGTDITQLDYCKPTTKDIVAVVDITTFTGNPSNLRFNYTWYKDNVQIGSPLNSTLSTNPITTSDTGIYKVIVKVYDIVNDPSQNDLTQNEEEVDFKFHVIPDVTVVNTNTACLNTNPVLNATINNSLSMNNTIDNLTYQWFRNNIAIGGATSSNFVPTQPGDYFVRVSNTSCSAIDSNSIHIIANPNVTISTNQTICEGSSYTITSSNANSALNNTLTYEWFKDNISTNVTTATYTVSASNQDLNSTSAYYVVTTEQGQCSQTSNTVNITINALPVINTIPVLLEQCDFIPSTIDGIAESNLTQAYNDLTNNVAGLTLYYYHDLALTNQILNPAQYINSSSPFTQTIYVKAINENVTPNCPSIGIGVINLQITPTSVSNYPNMAPVCPETNTMSGFINFDAQRILIKNAYFPVTAVDITFFLTPSDASVELNPLTNSSLIPIGTSVIYTRIETNNNCGGIGTFNVTVKTPPLLTTIQNKNICMLDTYILNTNDSEALFGQNATVSATYFNNFNDASSNNIGSVNKSIPLPLTLGTRKFFVRLYDSATQCFSIIDFDVNVFPNPTLTQPDPIRHCGNSTAIFDLDSRINQITGGNTNYQITFHTSNANLIAGINIPNPSTYTSTTRTIYIKAVDPTNNSCESYTTLNIIVLALPGSSTNPTPQEKCNDSGYEKFDLRASELQMAGTDLVSSIDFRYYKDQNDALLNNTSYILNPGQYTNSTVNYQKIYVRLNSKVNIDSETQIQCFRVLELNLFVRKYPENKLLDAPYTICIDQSTNTTYPVEVKTFLSASTYSFVWYNGFNAVSGNEIAGANSNSISLSTVGEYSVKVTNTSNAAMCSSVFDFTTQNSFIPNTVSATPNELIAFGIDNTIIAVALPTSNDYLYSLDGSSWQESNVFNNIPAGYYTLRVTNKFGCGEANTQIGVVDYPNFFTPNGDGYHETWNISNPGILDNATVYIFDKFGKLIKQLDVDGPGWNGTFNGKPLPSDDYWFKLEYTKNNITREFKSHFSLKR